MKITLLHPSRKRDHIDYLAVIEKWNQPSPEYHLGIDQDETSYYVGKIPSRINVHVSSGLTLQNTQIPLNKSNIKFFNTAISKTNAMAAKATGDWLWFIADDFEPSVYWYTMIESALMCFDPNERIVFTLEGKDKGKVNHPIMSRGFYKWQGYFWHPEYAHVYCDDDLYLTANSIGALKSLDFLAPHFSHNHPVSTGDWSDKIHWTANQKHIYDYGYKIFEERKNIIKELK